MIKQKFQRLTFVLFIGLFLTTATFSQARLKEAWAYQSLQQIHRAQLDYQLTIGNGKFAKNLSDLADAGFIDKTLGTSEKHGFQFVLYSDWDPFLPFYQVTATPTHYPRNGRLSFYLDSKTGTVRGADKKGAVASNDDPFILICVESERESIETLRLILKAQVHYQLAEYFGAGEYGSLHSLHKSGLIDYFTTKGERCGYYYTLHSVSGNPISPPSFFITSVPKQYGETGLRSFYIDQTGILRGADKKGQAAEASDPLVEYTPICGGNERETIAFLRRLVAAQYLYKAAMGSGNFGSLRNLYSLGVIDYLTAEGSRCGYNLTITKEDKTDANAPSFQIVSVPQQYGVSGYRSFYVDQTWVIRGADKKGQPAVASDPPVEY